MTLRVAAHAILRDGEQVLLMWQSDPTAGKPGRFRAVDDLCQRDVFTIINLVVDDGVTVKERATTTVLTDEPHGMSVLQQ